MTGAPPAGVPAGLTPRPEGVPASAAMRRPRLGFLGVGWIGRHRLEAVARSGVAEIAAIADPAPECASGAARIAPDALVLGSLDDLFAADLDGLVIATPSALHAAQATAALERGLAVFCQKPLGRTETETRRVVDAARAADRLLGVDLSYRYVEAARRVAELVRAGELGRVYAADLLFHNAYGPDKPWFHDPALSGGGCVMDLGIHLVDLALWALDFPRVARVSSRLFAKGEPLAGRDTTVEDYAVAQLDLAHGGVIRLACSWNLPAGRDAVIEATFYGIAGGASFRNVGGSFYDFTASRFRRTATEVLVEPPDEWGGRAAVAWARRLAAGDGFDAEAERYIEAATVLDRIYDAAGALP